jgi:hypothetical protein
MTHFTRFFNSFIHFLIVCCIVLAGCKSTKSSIASTSQSATASETASRRTFSYNTDSFFGAFTLSIDSLICSTQIGEAEDNPQPTPTIASPKHRVFYGVHIAASAKENTAHIDSLVSREDKSTRDSISKESYSKHTPPASTNHHLFFIYVILILILIIYLKARFY